MRRNVILATILAAGLMGCGSFRDMFSAHADVAAEAGGRQLSAERLATIMRAGKGTRLTRETADLVANAWVDYSLVAQAAATGRLPDDSATIAEVVWPEIAELKGMHWHDTLMARRDRVSDASVDSLYNTDVRLLQHILFTIRPNTDSGQRAATIKQAEATLGRIRAGANFGALATALSGDPGSKVDSGYLPPSPKGRFVVPFDSAGWLLKPGQVSGLVHTPFGVHILRYPTLAEARSRLRQYLARTAGARLDSIYMDSLALRKKLQVAKDAPAAIRAALEDPAAAGKSTKKLVSYSGGAVTVKDMTRWVRALPSQYLAQIRQADDATLTRFARLIAQNVLLLNEADSAGIELSPDEWAQIRTAFEGHLDSLKRAIGLDSSDARAADANASERQAAVGLKVERYFDQLVDGKTRLRPIPSALSTILRERLPYRIYDAGLASALELATAANAKADSAGGGQGPMQRAPGPPPIPGMQPSSPAPGASSGAPGSAAPRSAPPEGAKKP
jgi:PPIC-type PPIASE domain